MRRSLLTICVVVAGLVLTAGSAGAGSPQHSRPPVDTGVAVRPPAPELTEAWWQTYMAAGSDSFERCDLGPASVVFLAGTGGGTATRNCTVPAGKSLLVPLINIECSTVEGDGPGYRQLRECAAGFANDFDEQFLSIDGTPVADPDRFRVPTKLFKFSSTADNIFGIPATRKTNSVSDGFWAEIAPLPAGTHTVSFGGSYPPGPFSTETTYILTVV